MLEGVMLHRSLIFSWSLPQLGWIPFSRHESRPLRVARWLYVLVLNVILLATFACQIAICFRRDGFVFTGLMSNSSTITCDGEEHVVTNSFFQVGLLWASYWFGIYLFSGRGDSEHLFSLASRVCVCVCVCVCACMHAYVSVFVGGWLVGCVAGLGLGICMTVVCVRVQDLSFLFCCTCWFAADGAQVLPAGGQNGGEEGCQKNYCSTHVSVCLHFCTVFIWAL